MQMRSLPLQYASTPARRSCCSRIPRFLATASVVVVAAVVVFQVFSRSGGASAAELVSTLSADDQGVTAVSEIFRYSRSDKKATLAIESWISTSTHVLLLVEEQSACKELTLQFGSRVECAVHYCMDKAYNIPVVGCLITTGEARALTKNVLYLNSDIIISDVRATLKKVASLERYVIVGPRFDVTDDAPLELATIFEYSAKQGMKHSDWGIDFFLFSKGSLPVSKMPAFLHGNIRWDNWLVGATLLTSDTQLVDASLSIKAVHIGMSSKQVMFRPGSIRNEMLWKLENLRCSKYGIGRTSYANYVVDANGEVVPSSTSAQIAELKLIHSLVHPSGCILLVTLSSLQFELFDNWMLWVARLGIKFLVLAMDRRSIEYARRLKLPFVHPPEGVIQESTKDLSELLYPHMELLNRFTGYGYCYLSLSPVSIVFDDPLSAFFNNNRFHLNAVNYDAFGLVKKYLATFANRSTPEGLFGVVSCPRKPSLKHLGRCEQNINSTNKQCIAKGFIDGKTYLQLDNEVASSGYDFFTLNAPQRIGVAPAIIMPGLLSSQSAIVDIYKKWNLWQPTFDSAQGIASPSPASCAFTLKIRILTMNRPKSLERLLISINNAEYDGDKVQLEIFVDHPKSDSSSAAIAKHEGVLAVLKDFRWAHGDFKVNAATTNQGLFKSWVQPVVFAKEPGACLSSHKLLTIEDDLQLSPQFYRWGKALTMKYRDDPSHSRMFGFALQRQYTVLGKGKLKWKPVAERPYSVDYLDYRVSEMHLLYRYQLLSTWGIFFNVAIWNDFVSWATVNHANPSFSPCIPYLFSNKWYLQSPTKIWSIWFNHYVYKFGLYSVYINYNQLCPDSKCSLVLNHRERGLHFDPSTAQVVDALPVSEEVMYLEPPPRESVFWPLAHYSLYDFFFATVLNEKTLPDRWRLVSGINNTCVVK